MAYEIDYNDKRFKEVEKVEKQALKESDKMYNGMISEADSFYEGQSQKWDDWNKGQADLINKQTDFTINKVEQEKEQAKKDYLKEQSNAYVDWQKQSNSYSANAEEMAASGLMNSGYSESSKVAMYNAYQGRVAMAREVYNKALLNYNNSITEARLQNSSALAQIAYQTLVQQSELALQGFQYKNSLLIDKANRQMQINEMYNNRWQNVLQQMNTENSMAEQVRQYNESLAEERRQFNEQMSFKMGGGGRNSGYNNDNSGKIKLGDAGDDEIVLDGGSSTLDEIIDRGRPKTEKEIKEQTEKQEKQLPISMSSVTDLGLGQISSGKLAELEASGDIIGEDNGSGLKVFRWSSPEAARRHGAKITIK